MPSGMHEQRALEDTLRGAHEELGLTYEQISSTLRVSERTLRRWRYRAHQPQDRHRERVEALRELLHVLGVVFPESDDRHEWLSTPNPHLRGRSPVSHLRAGQVRPVTELLAKLESGAFL
jgi:uncharacterized protein (DUF2384 family)